MRKIDVEKWNRRTNFKWFSTFTNPTFSFNVKVDVTDVVNYSKETKTSFFANFLYLISKVNNELEPLRLRYVEGEVIEYGTINPTFTVKTIDGVFNNAEFAYTKNYQDFYRRCREVVDQNNKETINPEEYNISRYDRFYSSCLTTIEIEGMSQPLNFNDKNSLNVPRIFWDKYRLENGRYVMLVNFTVSHVLMDGEDLAKALNLLKQYSSDFSKVVE